MSFGDLRKSLGDPFIEGVGVEIGAGLRPVHHDDIEKLYFFDKRNPEEFTTYFGAPPAYDLIDLAGVQSQYPAGIDFVTAHHVIEHIDNPIPVLAEWIRLLRPGGVMYFSIPSGNNVMERGRPITPLSHVLEDWFFERPAGSYESKQHIHSFIQACTACGGVVRPWFADNTIEDYARFILYDIGHRDDHDLHWHTYDLDTIRVVTEVAFFVAGVGCKVELAHESDDSLYIAVRRFGSVVAPAELEAFYADMNVRANRLQGILGTSVKPKKIGFPWRRERTPSLVSAGA